MNIASHAARGAFVLATFAAGSAFNVAQGNHFILPCEPDCRDQVEVPIGPGITGSWFDHAQTGQGFSIEVLPGQPLRMMASWFVFGPNGGQSWIVGQGPIAGTRALLEAFQMVGAGARFPPAYDRSNVHTEIWGTLTFTFSDCNHGRVVWTSAVPGYGNGSMALERLTLPAGLTCQNEDTTGNLK